MSLDFSPARHAVTYQTLSAEWRAHNERMNRWVRELSSYAHELRRALVSELSAPDEEVQLNSTLSTRPIEILHLGDGETGPCVARGVLPSAAFDKNALFFGVRVMLDAGRWSPAMSYVPMAVRVQSGGGGPEFALYREDGIYPQQWVPGVVHGVMVVVETIEKYIRFDPYAAQPASAPPIGFVHPGDPPWAPKEGGTAELDSN